MATPAQFAFRPEDRPHLELVHDASEPQRLWIELASRIGIEELPGPDEDGQTHVLIHEGVLIGAATVYTRAVKLGELELQTAEVESFSTNEANLHPAYLSLLTELIQQAPQLSVVNGVFEPKMAAVASDIVDLLPQGWVCEYELMSANGVSATTFDSETLASHLANQGRVEHAFKRL